MPAYRGISKNDWEADEKFKYVGRTMGCGCCSNYEGITLKNLKEHIASLEADLEQARSILIELENENSKEIQK